jgi:hypothetical protein
MVVWWPRIGFESPGMVSKVSMWQSPRELGHVYSHTLRVEESSVPRHQTTMLGNSRSKTTHRPYQMSCPESLNGLTGERLCVLTVDYTD